MWPHRVADASSLIVAAQGTPQTVYRPRHRVDQRMIKGLVTPCAEPWADHRARHKVLSKQKISKSMGMD